MHIASRHRRAGHTRRASSKAIRHASRLDQIDAALAALGRRLVVTTEAVQGSDMTVSVAGRLGGALCPDHALFHGSKANGS